MVPRTIQTVSRGGVLVEAMLALPLLILITFGIYQIFRMFVLYFLMSWTARQAVLAGVHYSETSASSTSSSPEKSGYLHCRENYEEHGCRHVVMIWRARRILESSHSLVRLNPDEIQIHSKYEPSTGLIEMTLAYQVSTLMAQFHMGTVRAKAVAMQL